MQVIMLDDEHGFKLGQHIKVKAGFGRNYLIPKGLAVPATEEKIKEFTAKRAEHEKTAKAKLEKAQQRAAAVEALTLNMAQKAGDEGKLFGSIKSQDIATAATEAGVTLIKSEVLMPDGPIRAVGECVVAIKLHSEVSTSLTVLVVAE